MAPFSLPDRYRLEGGIAAGGMAAVYAAHDTLLDRPVAIKVLADHLNHDVTARRRFQREARAAAALSSHPSVVTIFDVGEHEGRSFIVMERFSGGTVGQALAGGAPNRERALGWLRSTADALDAAHELGVVHRDVKPANLLLDERDRVAVADFGIASLAHETQSFTQTGEVLGTAAYLSPEQAAGEPATPASDRYALAVLAYELLTGRRPFSAEHFAAQARAHIEDTPPPAPGLPPAAQDVIARGLAKDPAERWPSARAFVEALTSALSAPLAADPEPTRAMPPTTRRAAAPAAVPAAAAAAAAAPAAAAPRPPRPPRPSQRPPGPPRDGPRSRAPVLAALGVVAVVGVVAALAFSGGDGQDSADTTKPRATPSKRDKPKRESEPAATATAAATSAATTAAPAGEDAAALHEQAFKLFQAGNYEAAIPLAERAVEGCGDSADLYPCAYAYYNLGAALNRAGRPSEAIPILQTRRERWPYDQPETVNKELESACENAGQDCSGLDGEPGKPDKPGKGPKFKKPKPFDDD